MRDATLEEVIARVPPSRLPAHSLISVDPAERVRHARGQSLPDWIAMRSGCIDTFPDGVAYPEGESEVRDLITNELPGDWPSDFDESHEPPNPVLARNKVRFVGEAVVAVVAESRARALDAIDCLVIDYEPLAAVSDPERALSSDAPLLYEDLGTNLAHRPGIRGGAVAAAVGRPAVTSVSGRFVSPWVLAVPMVPRAAAARFVPGC